MLTGNDPYRRTIITGLPDRDDIELTPFDSLAQAAHPRIGRTACPRDQIEMPFVRIGLKIGIVNIVALWGVGHHQLPVFVMRIRNPEPVLAIIGGHTAITRPSIWISCVRSILEHHPQGRTGNALHTEMEPLTKFGRVVGAQT
ncbi:hypothetical protein SDC9_141492 [bioreactor metagenome]|uniref:Uncharacterized protein n=1 Tax=bioreactor metagenome TaxID=1076179 RepID=A0A645DYC4_9ZZZZ